MSALLVAAIVFVALLGCAILGTYLRERLPPQHLNDDSKHLIEISLGVIGTVAGLVLGLLVATSFGTFQSQRAAVITISAKIALLDRGLAYYGPAAVPVRQQLKTTTRRILEDTWSSGSGSALDPASSGGGAQLYGSIQELDASSDTQKSIKGTALGIVVDIAQQRWLMYAQQAAGVSPPLIIILAFWFAITFLAFGLMTVRNPTTITALVLCALAIAGAVYLIEQLSTPFSGAITVSDAPLRAVYAQLGR
ncbi:MAG: hypothetical protein JO322_03890 [Candidatus Eremiobacteraeota bacterium]|nr:hypothetical protein [Candidatus Eremiobacteraeota bacterium]